MTIKKYLPLEVKDLFNDNDLGV